MSSALLTSPPDLWAGKSRNAKAQARHRAKRKAYIEQLEQTVSKLQTALALSAEDIVTLPTTQVKLRELKEENDSLRAELRKLHLQQTTNFSSVMQIPSAAEPLPHPAKRRRLSPDDVEHRYAYLDSVGHGIEHHAAPTPVLPSSASGRSIPSSFHNRGYQLQGPGGLTPESSQPTPLREEPFAWTPYAQPTSSSDSTPSWSYSGGHTRNRSSSSSVSSASSDAAPTPYMASIIFPFYVENIFFFVHGDGTIPSQSHVQLPSPLLPSEDLPVLDVPLTTRAKLIRRYETDGVTNEMVPLYATDMSGNPGSAQRAGLDIDTLNISSSGSWSDVQVWPYSTVRAF